MVFKGWDWRMKCMHYFYLQGGRGCACGRSHVIMCMGPAQVESALAVQKLRPSIDAIKRQYGEDRKSIQRETSALYEASGVSPTAGRVTIFFYPL